jgi:hypothetical protein
VVQMTLREVMTHANDPTILHVLLDLVVVVKVWDGGNVVHLGVGDWGRDG